MELFHKDEKFKEYIGLYPISTFLLFSNLCMYLLTTICGGSTNTSTLLKFGAIYKPHVLTGDWYRVFTSMFLHIGLEHFLLNAICILIFASGLEKLLGSLRYFLIYIISGLGAGMAVLIFAGEVVVAGASGAIFGIFGSFLAIIINRTYNLGTATKQVLIIVLVINLIFTFIGTGISVSGHIGGLVTGFFITFFLKER
jgi:rhomboid protease GluP